MGGGGQNNFFYSHIMCVCNGEQKPWLPNSYDDRYEQTMCGGAAAECSDDPGDIHHVGQDPTKTEACMSGYGVADMSGNVREWTASQPGTKSDRRTVKGGASTNNQRGTRCAYSGDDRAQNYGDPYTGFRCCLSLPSEEVEAESQ